MKLGLGLCGTAFLACLFSMPCGADELGDYLTDDGKLKEAVTVRFGNCFVAPDVWLIKPSGELSQQHGDFEIKLSRKQLMALAQHLATQEFNSLPETQGYDPPTVGIGYDYFEIEFGKKKAAFNVEFKKSRADYLPKPGDPKAEAWSRFIALELVLVKMLETAEVRAESGTKGH